MLLEAKKLAKELAIDELKQAVERAGNDKTRRCGAARFPAKWLRGKARAMCGIGGQNSDPNSLLALLSAIESARQANVGKDEEIIKKALELAKQRVLAEVEKAEEEERDGSSGSDGAAAANQSTVEEQRRGSPVGGQTVERSIELGEHVPSESI